MRDPFRRYCALQRRAITADYTSREGQCFSAMSAEKLWDLAEYYGWSVAPLVGTRGNNALVVLKHGNAFPELWVRPSYRRYRRAFGKFLTHHHGFSGARIPSEWHVDHLCSQMLFDGQPIEYYVRVVLLHPTSNTSFGAGFEKLLYTRERARGFLKPAYRVDYITFLKVRGVGLPSSSASLAERSAWAERTAQMLKRRGLDEKIPQAYDGMTMMLGLSYSGEWKPLPHTEGVAEIVREERRAYEDAPKVYVLLAERLEIPVPLGVYTSMDQAKKAAYGKAPGLWWKHRGTGEHSAWDESVKPNIEYRILPIRLDSEDLDQACGGAIHCLTDRNSLSEDEHASWA
jgi:hypothetical protein